MKVYKTTNYDAFRLMKGNRSFNQGHLRNLKTSISSSNLLEFNPIVVNEKFEVVDGQHRLEAARQADVPIYYTIKEGARLAEVILLNTNSKNWMLGDYLDSHIERGKEDYQILKQFIKEYNIPISLSLELLTKKELKHGVLIQEFKNGAFKITNLKDAEEMAQYLIKYKKHSESNAYLSREFIRALRHLLKEGLLDNNKMLKKLENQKVMIRGTRSMKEMYRQLEDIYNYHTREYNKVRFY